MLLLQRALEAVQQCEDEVRDFAQRALNSTSYIELKQLADLADQLKRIRGEQPVEGQHFVISPTVGYETTAGHEVMRATKGKASYPLFFRDHDRLVKVGWSKKDRTEYEHRTLRAVVDAAYNVIQAKFGAGRMFSVGALLPFQASDGAAVPDYQLYLTIKWLHSAGLLQKYGRDGYRVLAESNENDVESAWATLPAYSGGKQ